MTAGITKSEREELRRIARQQFSVLREELLVRGAEMKADVDRHIATTYQDRDKKRADLEHRFADLVHEMNKQAIALFSADGYDITGVPTLRFQVPAVNWGDDGRNAKRRAAHAQIDATVKAAQLKLHRDEADMLRTLAIGAIQSVEARAFLIGIPTVGELVPVERLKELEAAFDGIEPDDPATPSGGRWP